MVQRDQAVGCGDNLYVPNLVIHERLETVGGQHLPDELEGRRFYEPSDQGFEKEVARRMKAWEALLSGGDT